MQDANKNEAQRGKPMADRIQILLVEDNPADVDLTTEKLEESKILCDLHVVADGVEAMTFLRREDQYANAPRPDLVLLDLNLPRKDGREVLADMKADPSLKRIPVVVLTSSQAEEDVVKTYELQASAYVTKPVDLDGFAKIVSGIESFWFTVVRFPPEP
jgi:two-component system, chemotaxis family, response regulator Rcp1